jgi:hypothetical protein
LIKSVQNAARVKLAHASALTVASIAIKTRNAKTDDIVHPELFEESSSTKRIANRQAYHYPNATIGRRKS